MQAGILPDACDRVIIVNPDEIFTGSFSLRLEHAAGRLVDMCQSSAQSDRHDGMDARIA